MFFFRKARKTFLVSSVLAGWLFQSQAYGQAYWESLELQKFPWLTGTVRLLAREGVTVKPAAFRLMENGFESPLAQVRPLPVPISILVVLDASKSMRPHWRSTVARLLQWRSRLPEHHRAELVLFNESAQLLCGSEDSAAVWAEHLNARNAQGGTHWESAEPLVMRRFERGEAPLLLLCVTDDSGARKAEAFWRRWKKALAEENGVLLPVRVQGGRETFYFTIPGEGGWEEFSFERFSRQFSELEKKAREQCFEVTYRSPFPFRDGNVRHVRLEFPGAAGAGTALARYWVFKDASQGYFLEPPDVRPPAEVAQNGVQVFHPLLFGWNPHR